MLKVSEDSLKRAESLVIELKLTKEFLNKLYREDLNSMKSLAEILSTVENKLTLKDINSLFIYLDIEKMSDKERRAMQRKKPANQENILKKIKEIEQLGFTEEKIRDLYSNGESKNAIIEIVNSHSKKNTLNKNWVNKIFAHFNIEERTSEEINKLRMEKINNSLAIKRDEEDKYNKDKIVNLYKNGMSLRMMHEEYKIVPKIASQILKEAGIEVKRDIPAVETIDHLESAGYTKDVIEDLYCTQNLSFSKVKEILSDAIGRRLGDKTLTTVLKKLEIKKSREQLVAIRGAKSRAELEANLLKLKKAGFENLQELANHYDENKSLTREALLKTMNEKLSEDEEPFTQRWLTRHMDSLLSEDRLRGVSRVELEFIEFLKSVTSEDIVENSRSIIKPYELDAVIPSLSIAFEFNGDYWHSDKFLTRNHGMTSEEYHRMKFDKCEDLGIKLYFVWESDWVNDRVSVEAEILSVFNGATESSILEKLSLL